MDSNHRSPVRFDRLATGYIQPLCHVSCYGYAVWGREGPAIAILLTYPVKDAINDGARPNG